MFSFEKMTYESPWLVYWFEINYDYFRYTVRFPDEANLFTSIMIHGVLSQSIVLHLLFHGTVSVLIEFIDLTIIITFDRLYNWEWLRSVHWGLNLVNKGRSWKCIVHKMREKIWKQSKTIIEKQGEEKDALFPSYLYIYFQMNWLELF